METAKEAKVNPRTVLKHFGEIRMQLLMEINNDSPIGGPGLTVEIVETKISTHMSSDEEELLHVEPGSKRMQVVEENQSRGIKTYETAVHEDILPDGDDCIEEDDEAVAWEGVYNIFDTMDLKDCLRYLAIWHQLPRSAVNLMLAILRMKLDLDLPKDARTLVRTPTQVSIDGLPLHKGGPTQLWPILVKVVELPKLPVMTVATFSGPSKPESIEEFLRPLVDEANEIHRAGLIVGDKTLHFSIRNFVADSPARALIKATTSFTGVHGCLKCSCVGEYFTQGKKVIFDAVDAPLRTDAGFRSRVCPGHHKSWRSPLEDLLQFDLIKNVPVGERLHLIDLGMTVGRKFRCARYVHLKEHRFAHLKELRFTHPNESHEAEDYGTVDNLNL
ncbi:uncharacterized protein LOC128724342 [Anopheles nili]|uniref:uncharacterized protein LOC128724342 n=1 Tax=Anopheles nili TaxID=185578 RepID=UPI00237BDA01|nr:uncharacterized protein LOC128724342 [Anopheles nili]